MLKIIGVNHFKRCGPPGPSVVTIGNFDGCHRGHRRLVESVQTHGQALLATEVAMTFAPRPESFFRGDAGEPLLFTEKQKTRGLSEAGIFCQVVQPFDEHFASIPHDDFYNLILRGNLDARAVVVGYNFRFGYKRLGDASYLKARLERDGIRISVDGAVEYEGAPISSTRIRSVLSETGDVVAASAMLGRPYMLEGEIKQGDQLGRQLGVPTLNLEEIEQLLPRYGVYAGYVWLADAQDQTTMPAILRLPPDRIPAIFSLGVRPTLSDRMPTVRVEAHLLKGHYGANEHYGLRAGFYLAHRLRDELKFASLDELKRQMAIDIANSKALLEL